MRDELGRDSDFARQSDREARRAARDARKDNLRQ